MELTIELLEEKFDEYNDLYFDGELPTPKLGLHKSFRKYGEFTYTRFNEKCNLRNATITMSSYYDWDESHLRDILVHEMLHFKIERSKQRDKDMHGTTFLNEAKRLNEEFGLNITVNPYFDDIKVSENAPKHSLARFLFT